MDNMDLYINKISCYLNDRMEKKGVGPKELANQTGLTLAEIRNLREAKLKRVNMQNVVRLARCFGDSVEEILGSKSLPDYLKVDVQLLEYDEPFFSYYGDRLFGIADCFGNEYDEPYELCVVNTVHSFVEAHKLANGYYTDGIRKENTKLLTKENIEKEYVNYVLEKIRLKYEKTEASSDNQTEASSANQIGEKPWQLKIGKNLRVIREHRDISREKLAIMTGISVDIIYRIENGQNKRVDYGQLGKLALGCNCTLDFLLGTSVDPVADAGNVDVFYGLKKTFIHKHVQVGHDLAYVSEYMDDASKSIVKCMIDNLNLMFKKKEITDSLGYKPLSLAEVYVREQELFKAEHPNRGITIRKREYNE